MQSAHSLTSLSLQLFDSNYSRYEVPLSLKKTDQQTSTIIHGLFLLIFKRFVFQISSEQSFFISINDSLDL